MLYEPNAIPDARLWGDGRLVWTQYDGTGARQVLTATLTPDEVRALLADFVSAGYFGWDNHYSPGIVYDAPSTCLRVSLASDSHSVCETLSGAPRAFDRLYAHLAAGAGAAGTPFVPASGLLSVTALGPDLPVGSAAVEWPAPTLGLGLDSVAGGAGQWLEAEALTFAWNAINAEPTFPLFHDGDTYYQAQLRVPGVTAQEPPEKSS